MKMAKTLVVFFVNGIWLMNLVSKFLLFLLGFWSFRDKCSIRIMPYSNRVPLTRWPIESIRCHLSIQITNCKLPSSILSKFCNQKFSRYFNFVGRVVAKAIYDNKLLECYFTRAFYKHILGVMVTYKDMESEDYSLYQSLVYMLNNPVTDLGYEVSGAIKVFRNIF